MDIEIVLLRTGQIPEAKQLIYSGAHELFHERETLAESMAYYESKGQLHDVEEFQRAYLQNGGTFLMMRSGGRVIGTGALRRLEDGVGEIKRLWLLPEYHGQGLGNQMLARLLAAARERGYTRVRLETDAVHQTRALAFYRKVGFTEIPRYGDDADAVALELALK
jgi:ribosomal protein S18 acetylase RimI-like enzyme